ncbi:MAG: phospholipase [Comamonadaceae bacterium]|nr:phospholipase [Comamonadaceae bacterium]
MTFRLQAAAVAAALVLAACGGGGADTTPVAPIHKVKVAGDSLADSGTFGIKFTVQGAGANGGPTQIWVDRVAANFGQSLCAHYLSTDRTSFASSSGCTNYAVGGGRINYYDAPTSPYSIVQQLKDMGAAGFGSDELLLVDGGGNDAADLIKAYILASLGAEAGYKALLGTVLDAASVDALWIQGAPGKAQAGGVYMQALAKQFAKAIQTEALAKGAPRVAVLNMPGVTRTPLFLMTLQNISQSQGAEAAAQLAVLFDGWINTFNSQLAQSLAGDARVAVVDFYASFKDQSEHPAQYAYTNVTTPVCPVVSQDPFTKLPNYDFPSCTASTLSSNPPAGESGADWWKSHAFSDAFHPTPYAHQLMGQLVSRSLSQAGWL